MSPVGKPHWRRSHRALFIVGNLGVAASLVSGVVFISVLESKYAFFFQAVLCPVFMAVLVVGKSLRERQLKKAGLVPSRLDLWRNRP